MARVLTKDLEAEEVEIDGDEGNEVEGDENEEEEEEFSVAPLHIDNKEVDRVAKTNSEKGLPSHFKSHLENLHQVAKEMKAKIDTNNEKIKRTEKAICSLTSITHGIMLKVVMGTVSGKSKINKQKKKPGVVEDPQVAEDNKKGKKAHTKDD